MPAPSRPADTDSARAACSASDGSEAVEGRRAFGGFIGPRTLVRLVENTAPWLFDGTHPDAVRLPGTSGARLGDHGEHPLGWWSILSHADLLEAADEPTPAQRADYFALCLAAHVASVATYVPTDVDAKIRHALWLDQTDPDELARMRRLTLAHGRWDVAGVSVRLIRVEGEEPLSGHDGERLSVLCGALIGHHHAQDKEHAELFEAAIDDELAREARIFDRVARTPGQELTVLALAAILTHNAGDVMQALGTKNARCVPDEIRARFVDLARRGFDRYGGAFGRAAALYKDVMSPEGHRHYPLRSIKELRASPALLLPISPFLDDWGARLATWPGWNDEQRARVVAGLVEGCRKVTGQVGYHRALAGFERTHPNGLEAPALAQLYTTATKKGLKDKALRRTVAVRRESFESSLTKRVRTLIPAR